MYRYILGLFATIFILFPREALAAVATADLEQQLSNVQEGISRLIDEREGTREGTLRYQVLEKNIGSLESQAAAVRNDLTELETNADAKGKMKLESKISNSLEEMKGTLEEVRGG